MKQNGIKGDGNMIDWIFMAFLLELLIWCAYFSAPTCIVVATTVCMWATILGFVFQICVIGFLIMIFNSLSEKILTEDKDSWDDDTQDLFNGIVIAAKSNTRWVFWAGLLQDCLASLILFLNIKSSFFVTSLFYIVSYILLKVFTKIILDKCKDLYFYFKFKEAASK